MLGVHPFILLFIAAGFIYPAIANDYWVFNLTVGLVLAIACLGLLVVIGWGREISLAQAGLTGASLYLTGFFARGGKPGEPGADLPFPIAALFGTALVVLISCVVALVSMRLSGVYVIVLTLALQFLLENSLFTSEKLTGGLSAPSTPRPKLFGWSLESDKRMYLYILSTLLLAMFFLHRFRNSRFGRSLIMVGVDKSAAAAVGVSPWMYKVVAFGVAGVFAGVSGALSAPLYRNPPGILQYLSFKSLFYLSVPIFAGFESIVAVVAVACLFQMLPQILLSWKIPPELIGGVGLLLGVLAGPRGMGGAILDVFDPRARAKRKAVKGSAGASSRPRPPARPSGGSSAGGGGARPASARPRVSAGAGAKARPVSAGLGKK
ncbi:MAG TPA: branched-chain amino acid ABC transporter permease [Sporichthyaceae bacterium]|jgi:ABC-type branched-subunit amino acid transport system permease subunit|nr:branched-chain amino acid ABC transporter permease [Sporichthyaceae bacterium]